jgi:hypothetical protein
VLLVWFAVLFSEGARHDRLDLEDVERYAQR